MINLRYNNGRINSAETPFKIPDTWMWVKLGDIADLYTGDSIPELVKTTKYTNIETGYDYIGTKDVGFDNMIAYNNGVKIPYDEKGFKYAYDTSILLCIEGGSAGRKIGKLKTKVCFGNKLCAITPFGFDNSYLYYFLQSDFFRFMFNEQNSGIIGGVSIKKMFELSIPLPPLAEQKRIVEKIEELEPLINRYGKASEELARIKSAFPEDLRNSILQQAVEGKLVPQNPADEPAGELLKRIKQERQQQIKEGKIKPSKLPKSNEPLNPADMPFKIPDSWIWQRLDNVGIYKKGPFGSSLTKGIFVEKSDNTVKVYEQKNAIYKDEKLGNYYITNDYFEQKMKGFEVFPGDIIVSCAGTIGETFVLPDNMEKGIINQALMKIKISNYIYVPYFLVYFDFIIKETSSNQSKGSAIKNIPPFDIFKQLPIPIPPLAEQKRIVKKIKDLDLLINNLFELIA